MNRYQNLTRKQLEDHRLEIENRIKNLFWTVSGDYHLDIKADIYTFAKSENLALYDAMKQGAFAKFFDLKELSLYLAKKTYLNAKKAPLMELTQLCIDCAVYARMNQERHGTNSIREKAFYDYLALTKNRTQESIFSKARTIIMKRYLKEPFDASKELLDIVNQIEALEYAKNTAEIIAVIDKLYNTYFDIQFEEKHGSLKRVLEVKPLELFGFLDQDFLTDAQMEKILGKFLKQQGRDVFRLEIKQSNQKKEKSLSDLVEQVQFQCNEEPSLEKEKKMKDYVALTYGASYYSELEQKRQNTLLCKGIHRGCKLHFTDGVLRSTDKKHYQYRMHQMQYEKNKYYYHNIHRVVKRNIMILSEMLQKSLMKRSESSFQRATSGTLVPNRLWKLGKTEDTKLFDKKKKGDSTDFVVEILLDESSSQLKRQSQVATQGYILSEALSAAKIPHRMEGYSTSWEYTMMHRFRDYDDSKDMNTRIFEFHATGNNRDGLAIKAGYTSLLNRPEEHKILIVLSDGKPSDVARNSGGTTKVERYMGEDAVRDTAFEIRKARAAEICVLGVFAGNMDDLTSEKKIYGKDFAYIRNMGNFAYVVGSFLKRQIEEEE